MEAMLQSPNFLFHLEAGPDGHSVDYDIASRLSYLLQDTMPDKTSAGCRREGRVAHRGRTAKPPRVACSMIRARTSRWMSSSINGCDSIAC